MLLYCVMPCVTINGDVHEVESGKTIIEVADEVGIAIPRYCYHPDIGVEGSCRMCLIEAKDSPKLLPACATPVRDGMVVQTDTEQVREAVRYAMEFLLLHHPIDCPVCDQSGECFLQDYYLEHGGHESRYPLGQKERRKKAVDLGSQVKLDQERCILCTRCVRFTRDVTETDELQVFGRGHKAEIGVQEGKPFENPYSINVVDICPVGALTSTDFRFQVRAWFLQGTPSVCGGCSTGCNLRIDHSSRPQGGGIPGYSATEGEIFRTVGRRNSEVNQSWLCDEGRLSFHLMAKGSRLLEARSINHVKPIDDILFEAHNRFEKIRNDHGDTAVAALGSAASTNEALFLMKKYFRGHLDFRLSDEDKNYFQQQDEMLRRMDKHPNTRGALDLGLDSEIRGLEGLCEMAEKGQLKAVWIAFHPQLVGEDSPEIISNLNLLISAVEFSVVSTTHEAEWADHASMVLPMAGWSEEQGTYTNYAGRVQIANRAVLPQGQAQPLHRTMAEMVKLSGDKAITDPSRIFEEIAKSVPQYAGLNYDMIGPLGILSSNCNPVETT